MMDSGDCRTKLFKNTLEEDFGVDLPEYVIFGLGCGLDSSIIPVPLNENKYIYGVVGRTDDAEVNFCKMTGIEYEVRETSAPQNMSSLCDDIIKDLKEEKKVFAYVDRFYLDYLPFYKAHFGWHIVQIMNHCSNSNMVFLKDSVVEELQHMSVKNFNCAHYADIMYSQPKGKEIIIGLKKVEQITREQYSQSLNKQACHMLSEDGGLIQLKRFLEKLLLVRKKARYQKGAQSYIKLQLKFLCKTVREQEISGSLYRALFHKYLVYCLNHKFIENPTYQKVVLILNDDILLWKDIASIDDDYIMGAWSKAYDVCISKLQQICKLEKEVFTLIQNIN